MRSEINEAFVIEALCSEFGRVHCFADGSEVQGPRETMFRSLVSDAERKMLLEKRLTADRRLPYSHWVGVDRRKGGRREA